MIRKIYLIFILMVFVGATCRGADKRFTLVIDAGHGGHDAGAMGAISKEKDINLSVALAFGRNVEQRCPDVKVIYTRKTDVFIPLDTRANIANRNKADLFVSIHTNALPGGHIARGVETYTLGMARASANLDVAKRENSVILVEKDYNQRYEGFDPNSSESYIMFEFMQDKYMEKSVDLAKYVQNYVCNATNRADKGVHQAGFLVLRCTSMPSCLIELGFITTPDEEQYLNSEDGVENLGRGIFDAFVAYKNKYDKSVTIPFIAPESSIPSITNNDNGQSDRNERATETKQTRKRRSTQREERSGAEGNRGETKSEERESNAGNNKTTDKSRETRQQSGNSAKEERQDKSNGIGNASAATDNQPVFKLQIAASSRSIRAGSQQLQGEKDVDCFQEDDLFKYTIGASSNYNEIYKLRKSKLDKFPQSFIIAFKDGKKMNINAAIREYKLNKK